MPHQFTRRMATYAGVIALALSPAVVATGPAAAAANVTASAADVPSGNTTYKTTDAQYVAERDYLVATYPNLAKVIELPEKSTNGMTIWGLEITRDVHVADGKPVFVQVGTHHGNEWTSTELTWEFAWDLLKNSDSPEYSALLDQARVVIVPLVNPDGFEAHTRATKTGVDMNRNYGYGWIPSARGTTNGTAAWSEPETRNMQWLLSTRQATVFNTQHTCIQVVLYPPLLKAAGLTQDNDRLHAIAEEMATKLGPTYKALASAWDYETNGEAIDWAYYATRALSVTTETCHPNVSNSRHDYAVEVLNYYPTFKEAVLVALRETANPAQHSRISGVAQPGTKLALHKEFPMYTRPFAQPGGTTAPLSFQQELTSEMTVTNPDGSFSWSVNPSVRPAGAYTATGVRDVSTLSAEDAFVTDEPWILTCTTPDGATSSVEVNVDLGETARVTLGDCAPQPAFSDVRTTNPFRTEITWASNAGITTGYPDDTFRPNLGVTRHAAAAMLYRAENPGVPAAVCTTAPFSDVPADHPHCGEIAWLKAEGISTGYPNGSFAPNGVVNRGAMAAFLARAWGPAESPECADPFTDVTSGHPFCGEISWLADAGIATGWEDGTFRPSVSVSRQAFVAFLYRNAV